MNFHLRTLMIALLFTGMLMSCSPVKKVSFKVPVDTTTKNWSSQEKRTFALNEMGIYASNEFDAARLNGFEKLNDSTATVIINPENSPINNSAYYAFKVWSDTDKSFYFSFKYPLGFKHRYVPKLYKNGQWKIIDSTNIYKKDSLITIRLELIKEPQIVAAQEIQSSTDVSKWYSNLIKGKENFVRLKSVGTSTLGRNLPVLDIYYGAPQQKDVIVLLTRQHPPEVTGYYAFQNFLNTVLNESQLSKEFLSKYRVLAFPIMNPDGVDLGNWRHNAGGVDTNRDWSVYNQPEIKHTTAFIVKELKKSNSKIVLGLDFHSTYEDVFYTNTTRESTSLPNFIENWFKGLEENISGYQVNEKASNSTKPVSKGWFLYGHNAVGITFEIGDQTLKENIETIGNVSANEMMKILMN